MECKALVNFAHLPALIVLMHCPESLEYGTIIHMIERLSASTVFSVASAITSAVRSGHLVPGQRLTESEFTRRLGVSRSSVREAFQRLAADGLLALEPHRGVTVRQLSRHEVDNLFQIRASLEALAVRLAMPTLTKAPAPLLALQAELDSAAAAGDLNRFSDANWRFHALFTETARNDLLADMLQRLTNSVYWLQFRVFVGQAEVLGTNRQHRRLVDAIVAGNGVAAEATIIEHVESSRLLMQSLSDDHFAPSPTR